MPLSDFSFADRCVVAFDSALGTLFARSHHAERAYPAAQSSDARLDPADRTHSAALMRVNHAGEIAAQGLYHGQALTARDAAVRQQLYTAANEENDHLAWCERRLEELHSHPSRLAPLWYFGSVTIGALTGLAGDRWSLGFVAETENQVVEHLDEHRAELPPHDEASHAVVARMREDEARHATTAIAAGGQPLPGTVKSLMRLTAKIMTRTAYHV